MKEEVRANKQGAKCVECVCSGQRAARKSVEFGERGIHTVEPGLDLMGTTRTTRTRRTKDD